MILFDVFDSIFSASSDISMSVSQIFPIDFFLLNSAAEELDGFAKILEAEGVKVRRPEVVKGDFNQGYETPDFKVIIYINLSYLHTILS